MKHIERIWQKDGYTLRSIRAEDAEDYCAALRMDPEVDRLTGSRSNFTRGEVLAYFHRCLEADDRADFLILDPEGRILGESVERSIGLNSMLCDPSMKSMALTASDSRARASSCVRLSIQ